MYKYIIRRLLQAIPLLFVVSFVIFILMQSSGDPLATMGGRMPPRAEDRERLRQSLGLNDPIYLQYIYWLVGNDWRMVDSTGDGEPDRYGTRRGVIRGDFGTSIITRQPAMQVIGDRLENTLILTMTAQVIIIVGALFIGIFSAVRQYSIWDHLFTTLSFIIYSIPVFLLGIILIYIFAVQFRIWGLPHLPTAGMYDPIEGRSFGQVARHLVLPSLTIAFISIAGYSRYIRSTMLEVINSDYIRTARAKGLTERRTLFVHAFKNASLPLITLIGLDLPLLIAGAVVTETIFAWPGMGKMFIDHLNRSDTAVVMALLMIITLAVIMAQLLIDIVYTWLDPRIRYD
ncbi:MAG: ABC transporter permease [Anaerolineaceae bacterium]|nr:MAG: ABC transporter permease [Anaerolineaceae bacterium]